MSSCACMMATYTRGALHIDTCDICMFYLSHTVSLFAFVAVGLPQTCDMARCASGFNVCATTTSQPAVPCCTESMECVRMDANRAICVPLGTSKSRKMKGGWTGDLIDCTTSNHLVQDVSQHFVQADNSQQVVFCFSLGILTV